MKKIICFLICISLLFIPVYAAEVQGEEASQTEVPEDLKVLYAKSALLMDADSGRVLFEKNGFEVMPMASTTKIMTCIVTIENGNMDDIVTVSHKAASQPKVHMGMRTNQQFRLGDLLYSLMLESHNDTAVAIAEHIGGSVEGFAAMMNQKARDLGAYQTNFVTPNGLDAPGHQTTAADLALITRYALLNEQFIQITNTPSYSFSDVSGARSFSVNNKDGFLNQMEGALGVKTGFTNGAGYCFVGALERDGRRFISVVLACGWPPHKTYKWSDTQKLVGYGINHFTYQNIFTPQEHFKVLPVEHGQHAEVDTYINNELTLLLGDSETVDITYTYENQLKAPVEKNQIVGFANILIDGTLYCKFPIKSYDEILKIDFNYCFDRIWERFLLF